MSLGVRDRIVAALRPIRSRAGVAIGGIALAATLVSAAAFGGAQPKITARQLVHNLKAKTFSGDPVEMRLEASTLAGMLAEFEKLSGLKFVIGPGIDATKESNKQYNFRGYPWDRALDSVLTDNGLELRLEGDSLRVGLFMPAKDRTVSAFLVGLAAAGLAMGGAALVLARRRRRRRNLDREKKISLDPAGIEETVQRLAYLFQVEKIHRNGRLSLDSLAERLALQPYQLSGIVNSRLGKTFTDLVAEHRVEEVKKRLADPGESANILNIAYDAGFGTKASFNRIFKERTGRTPSEFKKRQVEEK